MWLVDKATYILEHGGPSGFLGWLMLLVGAGFWLWMFVDSIRREEYFWAAFIFFFFLSALFYYFFVFRAASPTSVRGFELPGANQRRRIKELQAQIHHLDKAHHHSQLGDVYFQMGKLALAEASYRSALERDPDDLDTRSHLGQCLALSGKPAEARPWLEGVCQQDPNHEYGYTQMAYAETLSALGDREVAIAVWNRVNEQHAYVRARVQLAELLLERGEKGRARTLLEEVTAEDAHTPAFQRKRDKVWVRRAKSLIRQAS
jgi:tetratricopeptide (TPR) repeat protein